jgi:DNA-binding YbaB/EbfC family protein
MTGAFGEMGNLLKQAQQMQSQLDKLRKQLAETEVEGSAAGGGVRVVVTCDHKVRSLTIEREFHAQTDLASLQVALLAALHDANAKADRTAEQTLSKVTGGMSLPGLF